MPGLDSLSSAADPAVSYRALSGTGASDSLFGPQQTSAGTALPARWYTLFGISDATAAKMNLAPTADQVAMFGQMAKDPRYAAIFQQSASAQSPGWEYSDEQKALVQQAQVNIGGKSPQDVLQSQALSPELQAQYDRMIALENRGLSGQALQDAMQSRAADVREGQSGTTLADNGLSKNAPGTYQQINPAGYQDNAVQFTGHNFDEYEAGFTDWLTKTQAAADNYGQQLGAGIQNYYASIGEDSNGISQAQIQANDKTYGQIQDQSMQSEWLAAQDPGNLSASLRAKWTALVKPGVEQSAAQNKETQYWSAGQLAPIVPADVAAKIGAVQGDSFQVTLGSHISEDAATGRLTEINNVPVDVQYIAPSKGSFDMTMNRLGGALHGAFTGFAGGGPVGAALGAYAGAGGGMAPISINHPFQNLGTWHWNQPQQGDILGDTLAMGSGMAFFQLGGAGYGKLARLGIGSAIGAVTGMLGRGAGQSIGGAALQGGVSGGISGLANGGKMKPTANWAGPDIMGGGNYV